MTNFIVTFSDSIIFYILH